MIKRILIGIFILFILPAMIYADVNDYLILQDIGIYKLFTGITGRLFSGPPKQYSQTNTGGILDAADHFSENDVSYEASYTEPSSKWPFVKVEVTQHAGSDSDKWLLHEMDIEFRNYYGTPGYYLKTINGNLLYVHGAGGRDYRWISGNKVIMIEYHDSQLTKPEPMEVVQAYLAKHPSTLQVITMKELGSTANKTKWIKNEMDRRLWLCDKWFTALQQGKAEMKDVLQNTVDSMQVFLDYREKYYGIKAQDEKLKLQNALAQNNGTAIKNKLTEYKTWWNENKGKAITVKS